MVLEFIYSAGAEKLKADMEARKLNLEFNSLSDEFVPEANRTYNKKYKNLKVVGGKSYDLSREKIFEQISKLSKD